MQAITFDGILPRAMDEAAYQQAAQEMSEHLAERRNALIEEAIKRWVGSDEVIEGDKLVSLLKTARFDRMEGSKTETLSFDGVPVLELDDAEVSWPREVDGEASFTMRHRFLGDDNRPPSDVQVAQEAWESCRVGEAWNDLPLFTRMDRVAQAGEVLTLFPTKKNAVAEVIRRLTTHLK